MKRAGGQQAANATGRLEPSVSKHQISAISSNRLWQIVALTLVGTIGLATHADAAVFWSDDDGGYSRPAPVAPPRAQRPHRRQAKPAEAAAKEASKPQGPLIIAISISHQSLKVYDANGFYAETPISTGMAGHSTPMGAFSVIQKQKMHRSNIYSGAPMPFMQRITWSGIAMHAGVLPGYPASHGCIRMPMAFAVKMYGWTRMGARVVVTPGELTPGSFSHPLLVTQKVAPQPVAMDIPKADVIKADATAKADKAAAADPVSKPEMSVASLDLRSTVGHDSRAPKVMDEASTPKPLSEQTHTADAGTSPQAQLAVTVSDAAPSASPMADNAASDRPADAAMKSVKSVAELLASKSSETAASSDKPVDAKPINDAQASLDVVKTDAPAESAKVETAKSEAEAGDVKADDVRAQAAIVAPGDKPSASVPAATNAQPVPDAKKDQGRPSDADKAEAAKPAPTLAIAKGNGPISVFISRKDAKLYVRQNFAPLFDVPVTIAPSDRPLGTHIFTAEADKSDSNILRWSVVTLPSSRNAERRDDDERASRRRKIAGAAEIAKPAPEPDSPAEALDRLTIPADAMARITEALSTGGSIIVSDQGIAAGETGEGTDFIVSLR
ncbi:L,D-transpeptidase [Bradyrhizobium sp. S69]|uniref:L,D-transpeptidase n=1 Tax=Bradyrhizobium sp. S69 TaxID=1641856 RepID=UPI00131CADDF|nr:L,D-transpeptidase [Bradyrhizobium sp. S69]